MVAVAVESLRVIGPRDDGAPVLLDGFSMTAEERELVAVLGPARSGKTALCNALAGLWRPAAGRVRVGDVDVGTLAGAALSTWRARQVAFVWRRGNALADLTALENVALALRAAGQRGGEVPHKARLALELAALGDRMDTRVAALAEGDEQRVAVARSVATGATLVVCDEPTAELSPKAAREVLALLARLPVEMGKTVVLATADADVAARAPRRVSLPARRVAS